MALVIRGFAGQRGLTLITHMTQINQQDGQPGNPGPELQATGSVQDQATSSMVSAVNEATDQLYGLKFTLETGESKLFTSLPISIGRAKDNDIILPDETVSSHHAQIYYDEIVNDICIVDLDSLNGLFIGDHPTHRNVLYDGAKIGLGAATLDFRDTGFIYSGSSASGSTA
ncbi:MAG: hypothetical protein A2W35_09280 [Chloroflexi bacterium RBG_16_57_11]|nr:MAG: hypothetical protein A2W35_09280 [Chloroflexi bacterium RBG_16_57_11]